MVEGQLRDSTRSIQTFFFTQREPEYDQDTYLHQRESTQVRGGGRDGRHEPDSGLGYTQDYRSRWIHENCVDPDSASQQTEQPPEKAQTLETGDTCSTSVVSHKNAVSEILTSSWSMHHQKSLQTKLYRQGTPGSDSTGGPEAPGPSAVRRSQGRCIGETASLGTGTTRNASQMPS